MTKKGFGLLLLAVSGIGGVMLKRASIGNAHQEASQQAADRGMCDEYKTAVLQWSLRDKVLKTEKAALKEHMKDWELQYDRDGEIAQINAEAGKQLKKLETDPSLVENKHLIEVETKAKEALAASKKALGYDKAKKAMDDTIKKATDKYEKTEKLLSANANSDESLTEVATAMKHAAEKTKNETIEAAKKTFGEIEEKYNAKVSEWDDKILEAKTVREEMLAEGRKRILKEKEKAMERLNNARNHEREKETQRLIDNRTAEEQQAVDRYASNLRYIHEHNRDVEADAVSIYRSMSMADKVSRYLKRKKVSVGSFLIAASIPVVGGGLLIWDYICFVADVVMKMGGKK